jgi:hypothetical protein
MDSNKRFKRLSSRNKKMLYKETTGNAVNPEKKIF